MVQIVRVLVEAAKESKLRMANGEEPACLLDFWSVRINEEIAEAQKTGVQPGAHCTDWEMGNTLMDFLFASQDASTASLTWTAAFMSERSDILARVVEEQRAVRPNDEPVSADVRTKKSNVVERYRVVIPLCVQKLGDTDT